MNSTESAGDVMGVPLWPDPAIIFAHILLAMTVILMIVLNPIGVAILRRLNGFQETTKTFMVSLTVSDLCTGIFCAFPALIESVCERWVLGDFLCVVWGIVYPVFLTLSILSLLLVTIDRFIAVAYPLRYPQVMTLRKAKVIVALVWSLISMAYVVLFGIVTPCIATEETNFICDYSDPATYRFLSIVVLTMSFGTILFLYLRVLRVARLQARRIADQNQIQSISGEGNAPQRISTKSATTVIIITGSLILSWTPGLITLLLGTQSITTPRIVSVFSKVFLFSNSWLNVVIYYWRNKELRQAVRNWIFSCFR